MARGAGNRGRGRGGRGSRGGRSNARAGGSRGGRNNATARSGSCDDEPRTSRSMKAKLVLPVSRIDRNLKKGLYAESIAADVPIYLTGVLEEVLCMLLESLVEETDVYERKKIKPKYILRAVKRDADLSKMFEGMWITDAGTLTHHRMEVIEQLRESLRVERAASGEKRRRREAGLESEQDENELDLEDIEEPEADPDIDDVEGEEPEYISTSSSEEGSSGSEASGSEAGDISDD